MNPVVKLLDWCKRERENLQMQWEMLRSREFRILKDEGSGQVDASSEIIEQISAIEPDSLLVPRHSDFDLLNARITVALAGA